MIQRAILALFFITVLASFSSGQRTRRMYAMCPPKFIRIASECYYMSTEQANWLDAHFECKDRDSKLAEPFKFEDRKLRQYLQASDKRRIERWIGGIYNWERRVWQWGYNGRDMTYQSFSRMIPGSSQDLKFHCAVLNPDLKYRWSARSCVDKQHFICQHRMPYVSERNRQKIYSKWNETFPNEMANEVEVIVKNHRDQSESSQERQHLKRPHTRNPTRRRQHINTISQDNLNLEKFTHPNDIERLSRQPNSNRTRNRGNRRKQLASNDGDLSRPYLTKPFLRSDVLREPIVEIAPDPSEEIQRVQKPRRLKPNNRQQNVENTVKPKAEKPHLQRHSKENQNPPPTEIVPPRHHVNVPFHPRPRTKPTTATTSTSTTTSTTSTTPPSTPRTTTTTIPTTTTSTTTTTIRPTTTTETIIEEVTRQPEHQPNYHLRSQPAEHQTFEDNNIDHHQQHHHHHHYHHNKNLEQQPRYEYPLLQENNDVSKGIEEDKTVIDERKAKRDKLRERLSKLTPEQQKKFFEMRRERMKKKEQENNTIPEDN